MKKILRPQTVQPQNEKKKKRKEAASQGSDQREMYYVDPRQGGKP